MADRTVDVIYGLTGQTVETYPPEWHLGTPSSATCDVFAGGDDMDGDVEFAPTVTVDASSWEIASASGFSTTNRRRLNVTTSSTEAVVGRMYVVTNGADQRELVTVAASDAAAGTIDLEDDLAYDYAASDTVTGLRMTFPVDATWVATEANISGGVDVGEGRSPHYKAVWKYTAGGASRRHYSYLRLVRQRSGHNVTAKDVQRYLPEVLLSEYRDKRGLMCRDMIDAAWGEYRADIIGEGYRPEQVRDAELVNLLVTLKTVELYARAGVVPGGWDAQQYHSTVALPAYNLRLGKAVTNLRVELDQGTDGAVTDAPQRVSYFRS